MQLQHFLSVEWPMRLRRHAPWPWSEWVLRYSGLTLCLWAGHWKHAHLGSLVIGVTYLKGQRDMFS
jgi:hypothetical protein